MEAENELSTALSRKRALAAVGGASELWGVGVGCRRPVAWPC